VISVAEIKQTIIDNIKSVCKVKKIKNVDIAEYMGVSTGSVSNWFKGVNFIDVDNLYKLCLFLGISLDQAFGISPIRFGALSDDEVDLLNAYRAAEPSAREIAVETLLNHPLKKENNAV